MPLGLNVVEVTYVWLRNQVAFQRSRNLVIDVEGVLLHQKRGAKFPRSLRM